MSKKMSKAQAKMNEENNTPEHIKNLANYLKNNAEEEFNRNENVCYYDFELPIKKMFGLHVKAIVKVCRYTALELNIKATNLYYLNEFDNFIEHRLFHANYGKNIKMEERTIKYYEDLLIMIFETMQNIKFNKFEGKFQSERTDNCYMCSWYVSKKASLDIPNTFECFENMEHIELTYDKCCVCFENTSTKTLCDHYLCVECNDKINIIYCECGGHGEDCEERCGYRPCPCCRKDLGKEIDDWKPAENP